MAATIEGRAAELLGGKNYAVITTLAEDGTPHSAVVWVNVEDGKAAVNSAVGRSWPTQLERDPRVTLLVYDQDNPYEYVEIRGRAGGGDTSDEADRHIDALAKKYLDADSYPFRKADEQRIKFTLAPERTNYVNQG
jgi:PPOX class probable F420-dependent enzyme